MRACMSACVCVCVSVYLFMWEYTFTAATLENLDDNHQLVRDNACRLWVGLASFSIPTPMDPLDAKIAQGLIWSDRLELETWHGGMCI